MNPAIKKIAAKHKVSKAASAKWYDRASLIYERCNPVQRSVLDDKSIFKSILCPRRAGKSYSITSNALFVGESKPDMRILIISLTLKSTKENFWGKAPGGIHDQNAKLNLGLSFNNTEFTWHHENGSRGRIAGADTRADIESFRGASAEADAVFIDEAGSFAPDLLRDLVFDILMPGLMTRGGFICLAGTPGIVPQGLFYESTSIVSTVADEDNPENTRPTCVVYEGESQPEDSPYWSLHKWSVKENIAAPEQWRRAQRIKKAKHLTDESPTWRREYLGEWVSDPSELVYYGYVENRGSGIVNWTPKPTIENMTSLNPEEGPWVLVMGVDLGYEDDFAIVYAGWSETLKEMRVFYTYKINHQTVDQIGNKLVEVCTVYGAPSVMVADSGALGKLIVETLNSRFSLSIIAAEKSLKFDHQELLNSDFQEGRIKIPRDSDIDDELCTLQWELTKEKTILVRTGKLREDPKCANHLCDALLYIFRYCYHHFSRPVNQSVAKGTDEWYKEKERKELEALRNKYIQNESTNYFDSVFKQLQDKDNAYSLFDRYTRGF